MEGSAIGKSTCVVILRREFRAKNLDFSKQRGCTIPVSVFKQATSASDGILYGMEKVEHFVT
jgi:hypothetical protein